MLNEEKSQRQLPAIRRWDESLALHNSFVPIHNNYSNCGPIDFVKIACRAQWPNDSHLLARGTAVGDVDLVDHCPTMPICTTTFG